MYYATGMFQLGLYLTLPGLTPFHQMVKGSTRPENLAVKSVTSVISHKQGNVMLPTGSAEFQHFILRFNKQAKFCPAPELS
jgi:hypothetical protein